MKRPTKEYFMVPFLLVYGPKDDKTDILSVVELKKSRRTKKYYINVYDMDYGAYSFDVEESDIVGYRAWAIPAILHRELDWGSLQDFHEELAAGWRQNKSSMIGITLVPETIVLTNGVTKITEEYFIFDSKTISVESTNLFLKPINGSIRLY